MSHRRAPAPSARSARRVTSARAARRGAPALLALAAAFAAGGCGSSGGRASSGTQTTAATTSKAGGSSLKVIGTPKFASPSSSSPVLSGVVHVAYRYITIHPDTLRVKAGTTVQWTNYDPVEHDVTSVSGPQRIASGSFGEGRSFAVRLTVPGVIHYEDTNYPATMNGTIEVLR